MQTIVYLAVVITVVAAVPTHLEWNNFKLSHAKVYSNPEEELLRFNIFKENLKTIHEHNQRYRDGLETYEQGINQFTDMTAEEFQQYLTLSGSSSLTDKDGDIYSPPENFVLPESVDYREQNAVNPIKDQGNCGSCWAFSAVGALESLNYLKTKKLVSLSEQNLVDCSQSYGNGGCFGGIMRFAYQYITDNGLETDSDYPYVSKTGKCTFNKTESVVSINGFTKIANGNEHDLQVAVADVGPLTVGVDSSEWQHYRTGVFVSKKTSYRLNHGVVVVGFGKEDGQEFYIIRNSWGVQWGEDGYIRVARNKDNQIGIANDGCFPNL